MIGAIFRFQLPPNLVEIKETLSQLESHGVPIFGIEELVDCVCYDVYGTKQCHDTVLAMSNPATVSKPHHISVEMLPCHPIIHPPVWIMKSTDLHKFCHITNYLDEDVYLCLIQWQSREALRFQFTGVFGAEVLHLPPLQPSNYFEIPPPPLPPKFVHNATLMFDDVEINMDEEMHAQWECEQEGVIEQELDESDEAFNACKVKAEAKKAGVIAEWDATAKYIQKARGGDLNVYHDIKKWITLGHKEKKPFDMFLTTMWRKVYKKEAEDTARNMCRREEAGHQRPEE